MPKKEMKKEGANPVAPAKNGTPVERRLTAGSFCDEFVTKATDEEQNGPDGSLQPDRFPFLAGTAGANQQVRVLTAEGWKRRQLKKRLRKANLHK